MKRLVFVFALIVGFACEPTDDGTDISVDNFDRGAMLANWADNIIVPAYASYQVKLEVLSETAVSDFVANPTVATLFSLRSAWKDAYLAWQSVAMFEIGKAESLGLQGYTNSYPVDAEQIESIVASGVYNLELPSRRNQQGLPALDYLINGLGSTDEETVAVYVDAESGQLYKTFLSDVSSRLLDLTSQVVTDWETGYRDTFVANDGSSATGAVSKLTNDYIFYYEKLLRASKIGIPAGVFSGSPVGAKVEAFYQNDFSKELFEAALSATQNFFNGVSFDGSETGDSFKSYLEYLSSIKDGEDLGALINDQFTTAKGTASTLELSFAEQVELDNTKMLNTYDELQQNVIMMKVDMMQALNIRIDYVDADGD